MDIYIINVFLFWSYFIQVLTQRCPVGWLERQEGGSCYRFFPTRLKSWENARATCQARGGDLLKLDSIDEKEWVIEQLNKYPGSYEWWIGLRRNNNDENSWLWTDGSGRNESDNYIQWGSGEPNNHQGTEDCAEIWDNLLNDKKCDNLLQYICERQKDVPMACDVNNGWDNVTPDRCYKLFSNTVTYKKALELCEKQDSELINIKQETTQHNISDFLDREQSLSVWLPYITDRKNPEWKDGKDVLSNSWWSHDSQDILKTEGNDSLCSVLDTNITGSDYNWRPAACEQRNSVLCSKPKGTCSRGFVQHKSMCYLLNTDDFLTWKEASGFCNLRQTNLLEIKDEEEWNFVSRLLYDHYHLRTIQNIWLGLTGGSSPDLQSLTWASDSAAIGDFATKMLSAQPTQTDRCVYIDIKTNNWTSGDCGNVGGAVCTTPVNHHVVTPPVGRAEYVCDKGMAFNKTCYFLMSTIKTDWFMARDICRQHGSDLATVVTSGQNTWIKNLWTADFANEVWIGLNDQAKDHAYKWLDSNVGPLFTNWMKGQPNNAIIGKRYSENCVAMFLNVSDSRHGKWVDYPCEVKRHFICQKPAVLNIAPGKMVTVNSIQANKLVESCSGPTSSCCSKTNPDALIDLGAVYNIKALKILHDQGTMNVYISKNKTFDKTIDFSSSLTQGDKMVKKYVNQTFEARYIRIDGQAAICNIEVFADETIPLSIQNNGITSKDQIPCVTVSSEWKGNVSYTISGKKCQAWVKDFPHIHTMHKLFTEETEDEAGNFCRDPIGLGHPWCYTVDPDTRWEYCGVEVCPACTDCKYGNEMLTWGDAKQVCAKDGMVLPLKISDENSEKAKDDLLYWLSVYYDGNTDMWYSSSSGLPIKSFLQDVSGFDSSTDTMCAVGNSKGQLFAKSCIGRFTYFCTEEYAPFIIKTISNGPFKDVPANYINKTTDNLQSLRFEFKGFDGATIKILDYSIRIGGNIFPNSYISRGHDPKKISPIRIENLYSETKYTTFWIEWTMSTVCKITVGRGTDVGKHVFLTYNNCSDRGVESVPVSVGMSMVISKKYEGVWKFPDPERYVSKTSNSEGINIAFNKPATQSSLLDDGTADKGVDGCTISTFSSKCVTHTKKEMGPWWQVDLGKSYPIKLIVITRRWDCCRDRLGFFQVQLSDLRESTLEGDIVFKSHESEPPEITYIHTKGKHGRYVKVVVPGRETYVELAEVEVYPDSEVTNIALNKPATQSSLWGDIATADKAVDGCDDARYNSHCITHTQLEIGPWWQVDLGKSYPIKLIVVKRRMDCCRERLGFFQVLVSHFKDSTLEEDVVYKSNESEPAAVTYIQTKGKNGRYVKVVVPGRETYVELAEVEVYPDTDASICGTNWVDNKANILGTCYRYSEHEMNWEMARQFCTHLDAKMVIPRSPEEQLFLYGHAPFFTSFWIGVHDTKTEGSFEAYDKSKLSYTDWAPGEPNNYGDKEDCASLKLDAIKDSGRWNDASCSKTYIAVCMRQELSSTTSTVTTSLSTTTTTTAPSSTTTNIIPHFTLIQGPCKTGWKFYNKTNTCVKIMEANDLDFYQAAAKCLDERSQLASITDYSEYQFLKWYVSKLNIISHRRWDGLWLGGMDAHMEDDWQWFMSNTTWKKQAVPWYKGQPDDIFNEDCLSMMTTGDRFGMMYDKSCDTNNYVVGYICQYELDQHTCNSGWYYNPRTDSCYMIDSPLFTWQTASEKCTHSHNGDLVSIRNLQEQFFLQALMKKYSVTKVWVGAIRRNNNWEWKDSTLTWNREDLTPYHRGSPMCGVMQSRTSTEETLSADICSIAHRFICVQRDVSQTKSLTPVTSLTTATTPYIPPGGQWLCGAGWDVDTTTGICYKFVVDMTGVTDWNGAQQNCVSEGGTLASIVSKNEQSYIIGRLQGMRGTTTGVWIGANNVLHTWRWIDKQPLAYLHWASEQPDNYNNEEDCMEMLTRSDSAFGMWNDASCNLLKGYICKKQQYTEGATTTTPKPFNETTEMIEFYEPAEKRDADFKSHDLFEMGVRIHDTFRFKVKTTKDVHIILQNQRDNFDSLCYYIIIGGWGNRKSTVKAIPGHDDNWVQHLESNILSDVEFRSFWISWNDTTILVGKSEDIGSSVFLVYTAKLLHINYVSVSSAWYTPAYWKFPKADKYYGCEGKAWMKTGGSCFLVVEEQKSWDDANTYCNKEGGDLASIDDEQEQNFIFSHLPSDRYCFNIHDNDTECILWAERGECDVNPVWMSKHCHLACQLCMTGCRDTYENPNKCMEWAASGECGKNHPWMLNNCAMSCGVCTGAPTRGYWIGLHSLGYEQSYSWIDKTRVRYTNWASHYPLAYEAKKGSCVGMFVQNGHWNDGSCSDKLSGFVCKKPISILPVETTLPPYEVGCSGTDTYGYREYCYSYQREKTSWVDAQAKCVELGGSLAFVGNRNIQAFLSSELSLYEADFWIGLSKTRSTFTWTGRPEITLEEGYFSDQYYKDNTVDGCFAMSWKRPVGLWNVYEDCTTKLPFICETPRDGFTTSTAISITPTDMSATCPEGWLLHSTSCYKMIESKYSVMTHDPCDLIDASVASISDAYENEFVSNVCTADSGCQIGLYNIVRYVDSVFEEIGRFYWTDGSDFRYSSWDIGEPALDKIDVALCAAINSGSKGKWTAHNCYQLSEATICEMPLGKGLDITMQPPDHSVNPSIQSGNCPDDWQQHANSCYKEGDHLSWNEAKWYCESLGASMATIQDYNENEFLETFCWNSNYGKCWLGLHDIDHENDFKWVDGTPYDFTNWSDGEPNNDYNEDCVEILGDTGQWNDVPCDNTKTTVCEKPTVEVETTTTTDTTYDSTTTSSGKVIGTDQPSTSPRIKTPELVHFTKVVEEEEGLTGGQVAGIVVGVLGTLVIIGVLVYIISEKRMKQVLHPLVEEQSLGFDNALFRRDQDTVSIK